MQPYNETHAPRTYPAQPGIYKAGVNALCKLSNINQKAFARTMSTRNR